MGYVICGPMGTGKTFITTCFAGEVGIPAVTLKNFRSMWQGVTEGNLERVLSLLKAMLGLVPQRPLHQLDYYGRVTRSD
jgi:SpoVK/Ycf46/Vps4 family AAA+-type ATPase